MAGPRCRAAGTLPVLIDRDRTIDTVVKVIALSTSLLVERGGTAKAMPTGDARWNCGKALADDTGPEDRLGSAHDRAPATGPADP